MPHENQLNEFARGFFAPMPTQRPSEWCCDNLRFDEPGNRGPFTTAGREYIIEPLDDWANLDIADCVEVFGSQTGKTAMLMGGTAWTVVNDPCGMLWVMPSVDLARSFSEVRWQSMLKASEETRGLIPIGQSRHAFKKLQQQIGSSVVNFVGSNSPANLASRPARKVILDEVDKFDLGGRGEADAVNLAEQRTKGQAYPQRRKTSTPSVYSGLIWQEFLKGDQRRFFVPCPLCGIHHPSSRMVVFAWSPGFSVFPKTGREAYVKWDPEARRKDGTWDFDRVVRSARFECPHCHGHIMDAHKTRVMPSGQWEATAKAEFGFRSRHLPSLYSCSPETTVGKLAVKFLQSKRSLRGLQGFINGDLAEPYESQDRQRERTELITSKLEVTAEWVKLLEVDCQAKGPEHFWAVARAWNGGNSEGLEAVGVGTFEDVRDIQKKHGIQDAGVMIDSGYGARDDAEVYRTCARFCEIIPSGQGGRPMAVGWMPAKGMPTRRRWKDENGLLVPYYLRSIDPFMGTADAGKVSMTLFEFAGSAFKDILDSLRKGKGGYTWKVSESMSTETYWRHMDAEIKSERFNQSTGVSTYDWKPRSRHWPNHLFDCEVMQVAHAAFLGLFELPETKE